MMDSILIEGLTVETVVGCFEWERKIIQPLLIDLVVDYDLTQAANSDELLDTINYAQICELTTTEIQEKQPKLLEHAAQCVMLILFETFEKIENIKITIKKPAIIPQAQSVGIRLERKRTDLCARACQ